MATPLDEIQWKSPEWIQHFGLYTANVLDYFAALPFYDRTSNNQVVRMQFQFTPPPQGTNPAYFLQEKLQDMVGVEFIILYVREPDFWIIRKQKRLDRQSVIPLNDYYIVGANVYQAPRIYDVLSSRLLVLTLSIKNSVSLLNTLNEFQIGDVSASSGSGSGSGSGPSGSSAPGGGSGSGAGSNSGSNSGSGVAAGNGGGTGLLTGPATGTTGSPGTLLNPGTVGGGIRDGLQLTPMTVVNPLTSMQNNANGMTGESTRIISSQVYDSLLNAVVALAGPVYLDEDTV
ncbi:Mediator of RNA polymerase II transcription subunit 6 [Scheffersomyces spartinae]|uniref:Mediator of RNA polymerase II transcription subunit 6 n=1 Tax=Scheffersomyces spartinae TaxID=45513 RepID=A0A9P7V9V6_9ASCO|nr:Mediator of RNA polymerase II transcription subunit 6 [Scheffersomyces spartinae]KAG7194033.1 Mediator of RNA polymerase II transcription subunit 6 [Scheffersomyces spartinae]